MMLADELAAFEANLIRLERPVVPLLNPGVDEAAVVATLGEAVPKSVKDWFGWCNGVVERPGQILDDVNVIPGYCPVSVAEIPALLAENSGDPVLGMRWAPLLVGGSGDMYAAIWGIGQEASVASVLIGEQTKVEFASIAQMVEVFNAFFTSGAYYVDTDGMYDSNPAMCDEVYDRIVGKLN